MNLVEGGARPVEAAMGTDADVERGRRSTKSAADHVAQTRDRGQGPRRSTAPTSEGRGQKRQRCLDPMPQLVDQQLASAGSGPRDPLGARPVLVVGIGTDEHVGDRETGDAIGHAVVHLGDQREPIALEAIHEPVLPQRLAAVELLGQHPTRQSLELADITRRRQRRVPHVETEVEVSIVDPDGLTNARYPGQTLPKPRDPVEPASMNAKIRSKSRPPSGPRSGPASKIATEAMCMWARPSSMARKLMSIADSRS